MRLGIFGGTFDPVHNGHLLLAEYCREQGKLDQVWFLPAFAPPHKLEYQLTASEHRIEMLRLAIGGHSDFLVSTIEIERGGVSFTVDTVQAIAQQYPDADLFLLMGADSLWDLPTWRKPSRICQLAIPLVVGRPNCSTLDLNLLRPFVDESRWKKMQDCFVEMPEMDISSRDIRGRVSRQQSIRYQTPRAVEKYIETNGLYQK